MTDEYYETRTRHYMPKKKKDGGKLERFIVRPMLRLVGPGDKSAKEKRLTA